MHGAVMVRLLTALTVVLVVGGCADNTKGSDATDRAVVTFEVAGEERERFKALLITRENVDIAKKLLQGEEAPGIPNGVVVRGDGGVNAPWTWHLDPASIEFADFTTGVCDGLPSGVEAGTITSDRYCPWSAKVIAVDPA